MLFRQIADPRLSQCSYLIGCPESGEAVLVDPLRTIDPYLATAADMGLEITAVVETHIHEDFLAGTRELAVRTGAQAYLSGEDDETRDCVWEDAKSPPRLLRDGDSFTVGQLELVALHTPGPTPEHLAFLVRGSPGPDGEAIGVLCGDLLTVGDVGSPHLTCPSQTANVMRTLHHSLWRILDLPEYLQLWPAHRAADAQGDTVSTSTIGYEQRHNFSVRLARLGADVFAATVPREHATPPPPHYTRLRALNRQGAPLLGDLPRPPVAAVEELFVLATARDAVVIDTRPDRQHFLAGHLPSAIHAPVDQHFADVVGTYVAAGTPLFLIASESTVEDAVRALVELGLDEITGYATPETLAAYSVAGGELASLPRIDFERAEQLAGRRDVHVLDVRPPDEHAKSHLPGAHNVPHTQLLCRIDEIPRERRLLVHCSDGARATSAASWLARLDYQLLVIDDVYRPRPVGRRDQPPRWPRAVDPPGPEPTGRDRA